MNTEIIEDQLFGNTENAFVLFEYRKELDLLKDFIEYAEDAVECNKTESMDSSEGICYAFAKSIIGYAKMISYLIIQKKNFGNIIQFILIDIH